jgi:uncharacterized protein YkwD
MGSRHVTALIGAVFIAGVISFLSGALHPERAGAEIEVRVCGDGNITLKAREKRVLALHNEARKRRELSLLCADPELTRAARSHSREMVEKDYFSHYSYNGESAAARLERFGYDRGIYGENLAGEYGTGGRPGPTFRRWMDSPGHKANILDGRFRPVGVGTYTGNYKGVEEFTMYTVDFGVRR